MWQRVKLWWCRRVGHRGRGLDAGQKARLLTVLRMKKGYELTPDGAALDICARCGRVLRMGRARYEPQY